MGSRLSAIGRKRDGLGNRPGLEMLRPGNVRGRDWWYRSRRE